MADVARGSVLLTPRFDNLTSSVNKALSGAFSGASSSGTSAGTSTGSNFASGFSAKTAALAGTVGGIMSTVASTAISAISSSMSAAVSRVDTLNNFPKVMQNLGYAAEDASTSIQKISTSLDGLPSSTDNVASMVQQLAPMCASLDEATSLGLAMNDMFLASGASTADCSRAMQQYTQIMTKGKPDLQDWKTLQEVMPGQLNQVSEALLGAGSSSTDLYNALKAGTVTMDDFNATVMRLDSEGTGAYASFAQQAKDATQGIGTAMDNVQNRIAKAIAKIIDAIGAENISGAINAFSSSFSSMADGPVAVVEYLKGVIDTLAPSFQSLADAAGPVFGEVLQSAAAIMQNLGSQISAVLVPAIQDTLIPACQNFLTAIEPWIEPITNVANIVGNILVAALTIAVDAIGLVIQIISEVINSFTMLAEGAGSAVNGASEFFSQLPTNISNFLASAVSHIVDFAAQCLANAVQAGSQFLSSVASFFSQLPGNVWSFLSSTISKVASFVADLVSKAVSVGSQFLSNVGSFFSQLPGNIWGFLTSAISKVASFVTSLGTKAGEAGRGFLNGIKTGFESAVSFVTGIPSRILSALGNVGSLLVNAGSSIINGLLNGIKSAISGVYNFVSGIAGKIASLKGPLPYDRRVLIPNGQALMESLYTGLSQGFGDVESLVSGMADTLAGDLGTGVSANVSLAGAATAAVAAPVAGGSSTSYNFTINGLSVNDDEAMKSAMLAFAGEFRRAYGA